MRSLAAVTVVLAVSVSAFATERTSLKETVREELIAGRTSRAGWVRVRTEGATVTLLGRVPDELTRAVVVQSVRNVPGVKVVNHDLTVDGSLPSWKPTRVELARLRLENARRSSAATRSSAVTRRSKLSRKPLGFRRHG